MILQTPSFHIIILVWTVPLCLCHSYYCSISAMLSEFFSWNFKHTAPRSLISGLLLHGHTTTSGHSLYHSRVSFISVAAFQHFIQTTSCIDDLPGSGAMQTRRWTLTFRRNTDSMLGTEVFLRNVGIYLWVYTAPELRISSLLYSPP